MGTESRFQGPGEQKGPGEAVARVPEGRVELPTLRARGWGGLVRMEPSGVQVVSLPRLTSLHPGEGLGALVSIPRGEEVGRREQRPDKRHGSHRVQGG